MVIYGRSAGVTDGRRGRGVQRLLADRQPVVAAGGGPVRGRGRAGPVFLDAATAGVAGWSSARRSRPRRPAPVATEAPTAPGSPYPAAKTDVERMVAACGSEHAILRCSHVLGQGSCRGCSPTGSRFGAGRRCQRAALVWVGDVAAAIAAADDAVEVAATYALAGPRRARL